MTTFQRLLALSLLAALPGAARADDPCATTAAYQRSSASFELKEELLDAIAVCINVEDPRDRAECLNEARADYLDGLELVQEQYDARLDLCGLLGGGTYDPEIEPRDFTTAIDNPWLPLPVGAVWNYESLTEEGLEEIEVTVLPETRTILGVECVTVRDTVTLEGELVEDTLDWYAQDEDGNVWYFGEIVFNYEEGYVADIDGSWLAGVDGAKPGIVMLAAPAVGATYRQEWLAGEAEDAATVLDDGAAVTLGLGTFTGCLQTADFTPVEPDALEHKFYASGIGFLYETKPGTSEVLELVGYSGL